MGLGRGEQGDGSRIDGRRMIATDAVLGKNLPLAGDRDSEASGFEHPGEAQDDAGGSFGRLKLARFLGVSWTVTFSRSRDGSRAGRIL